MKRLRHLLATMALVLFVPGRASTALTETSDADPDAAAQLAEKRQQRVEELWIRQELWAEARARGGHPGPA